jgi:glycosyltransferase involved in cell wall biosynthesis
VLSWWQAVKGEPAPESIWGKYREHVTLGLCAADHVVAPSRAMLDCIHTLYGVRPRSSVIPNGRDSALISPVKKRDLIMAVGRLWDDAKNILTLDRIAGELPWPVYIAGDAAAPKGAQGGFHALNVKSLGRLPSSEIARWMAHASIYCLPARYEPFGLSVLEAALSGCALVLGDIPSLRENWDEAALFVTPGDDRALVRALNSLVANESLRAKFATAAHTRAAAFSPLRMARSYIDVYAALLGDHSPAQRGQEASACAS